MKIVAIIIVALSSVILSAELTEPLKTNMEQKVCINTEEDIICINEDVINDNYDILGRAEEVNLISEYDFLSKIVEKNKFKVTRQIKIYQPEFKGQKQSEFSKFQENMIIYKLMNEEYNFIEMNFSQNRLLGDCIHFSEELYQDSIIQGEKVKIFEYPNPENYNNVTGIAFFYIGDMNFRVKVYNVSHEKFIEIIRDSIREYKK